MGAPWGTRCPLRVAQPQEYQMKCLWLAGPGHVSGALRRPKLSGSLITRQGQPEAPSEQEPLALPLATETKDHATAILLLGRVCVCVCFDCDSTQSGRDREKPPHPMKGSSEKATSTGVSSSNGKLLWLPNGENGCHAWQASHRTTTTNQIGGIKQGEDSGRTLMSSRQETSEKWKSPSRGDFPDTDGADGEPVVSEKKPLEEAFIYCTGDHLTLSITDRSLPLCKRPANLSSIYSEPSISLLKVLNKAECQVDNKEPHKAACKHTRGVGPCWGFLSEALVAEAAGCDRVIGGEGWRESSCFSALFHNQCQREEKKDCKRSCLQNHHFWTHTHTHTHTKWACRPLALETLS